MQIESDEIEFLNQELQRILNNLGRVPVIAKHGAGCIPLSDAQNGTKMCLNQIGAVIQRNHKKIAKKASKQKEKQKLQLTSLVEESP